MKLTHLAAAAGLAIAALGAAAPASAQHHRGDDRGFQRDDDRRGGYDRRDDHRGYDRGRHHGYDNRRYGRNCRIVYRHHRRVRICR